MPPAGQMELDYEYLSSQAKLVASDVATEKHLYLAPEALPAVDAMVEQRKEAIQQSWRDLETWKKHVRHISTRVADLFIAQGVRRITTPDEIEKTAQPLYRVYPYD